MTVLGVYVIRHAEAEEGSPDAHRALTARGRRQMRASAQLLAQQEGSIDLCYSSPLVRAVQTAEILVGVLGLDGPLEIAPELAAPARLELLTGLVEGVPSHVRGVALVGHEPSLGALVSKLLHAPVAGLRKGEIIALLADKKSKKLSFSFRIVPEGPTRTDELDG